MKPEKMWPYSNPWKLLEIIKVTFKKKLRYAKF
jgi:hypothetical protein